MTLRITKKAYKKYYETQLTLSHIIWIVLGDVKIWLDNRKSHTMHLGYGNFCLTEYYAHDDYVLAILKCRQDDAGKEFRFDIPLKYILFDYRYGLNGMSRNAREELEAFQKELGKNCILYDIP